MTGKKSNGVAECGKQSAFQRGFSLPAMIGSLLMALLAFAVAGQAQTPAAAPSGEQPQASSQSSVNVPCPLSQKLLTVPEIKSVDGYLKGVLTLTDGQRGLWRKGTDTNCLNQFIRYFTGHSLLENGQEDPAFASGELLPGPTLRAKVGDLIELTFINETNTHDFPDSLDRGENGQGNGCDITYGGSKNQGSKRLNTDVMPNCLHGSSTANVHFHGTHTTPSTTGDNVLLFVRPTLRNNPLQPSIPEVIKSFEPIFRQCEQNGPPRQWAEIPQAWRDKQFELLNWYDKNTPYQGNPGTLPKDMQLWPVNDQEIKQGLWPQYHIGAFPYCFRLPQYKEANGKPSNGYMGQAPGTHWYHAHKHGSTAINVGNGMIGAFIIEGQYDEDLRNFYKSNPAWEFREQVLVIQQLTTTLNLFNPIGKGPHTLSVPVLSINGRRAPVITMRRNQVQLWRFVNGAERDAAVFQNFTPHGSKTSCSRQSAVPCVHWNQTAQDGVQFDPRNYDPNNTAHAGYKGEAKDASFNLAPGNRADLLVQAPPKAGQYELHVQTGLCQFGCEPQEEILLTVNVEDETPVIKPEMPFIPIERFPVMPSFLKDIPESSLYTRRELAFQDYQFKLQINGRQFDDHVINQAMLLNTIEEWKVMNLDNEKEHPFHIHVNPFQIVELFEPQNPHALKKGDPCYVDPNDPATWKPCHKIQGPFVWWDTFAIPASQQIKLTCTKLSDCPAKLQPYIQCTAANGTTPGTCTEIIAGYFKMRSRFVDFPGQFVLHCHILTHEDRGMMELIEVVPDTVLYTHH